jgi:hypothetical protein
VNQEGCDIMKLEEQLTSLEPSKRLKELGVKQESIYHWIRYGKKYQKIFNCHRLDGSRNGLAGSPEKICSAYSIAENLEQLPSCIKIKDKVYWLNITRLGDYWEPCYVNLYHTHNKKLSDALAELWIYTIENKLIK